MASSDLENGFLVLDKPEGITSHDAVQAARRHLKLRRIGHLGTLDPLATGVLPLALGKATRLIQFLKDAIKVYEGTLRLGWSTDTYDREGQPTSEPVLPQVQQQQLDRLAAEMSGAQAQVPPPFSAKRIQGERAYELARAGVPFSIPPQPIRIESLELRLSAPEEVSFAVRCSAGTYVRSIAHDLGTRLGCGAHLTRLRRLASGDFLERDAIALSDFLRTSPRELAPRLIRMGQVLADWPVVQADAAIMAAIVSGRDFEVPLSALSHTSAAANVKVLSPDGQLAALAEPRSAARSSGELEDVCSYHPFLVLAEQYR